MFSSQTDQWATPQDFFDELNKEFHFTLDPCADEFNHKCEKYFTKDQDGLGQCWLGERVFCNPPYGREIGSWVRRCYLHSVVSNGFAVMLIPARTDTKWFHDYIYNKPNVEIRFIKGRLKFGDSKNSAPFPSMVVIFNAKENISKVDSIINKCIEDCGEVEPMIKTYEKARSELKQAEKEGADFKECETISDLCFKIIAFTILKMNKTE